MILSSNWDFDAHPHNHYSVGRKLGQLRFDELAKRRERAWDKGRGDR